MILIKSSCQLFHVCQLIKLHFSKPVSFQLFKISKILINYYSNFKTQWEQRFLQHTFICGNGTVFNQLTQTCTYESQLPVPCESSHHLFYMNKRIGLLDQWFHSNEDFQRIKTVNNDNRFNAILNGAQNSFRSPPVLNSIDENDQFNHHDDDDDFK